MDRLDLHAYADGELQPAERSRVEEAVASSPELARELEAIQSLKNCLQTKAETVPDKELWSSCVGRLNEIDKARRVEGFVGKYAWALCGLFFLVILGGGYFNRLRGGTVGTGEVASYASSLFQIAPPTAAAPEQLNKWIDEQVGSRPSLHLQPSRVTRYRLGISGDRRILCVGLRDSKGELALMVIPGVSGVEGVRPMGGGMFAGQIDRVNCVTWGDQGCAVVLMGDRDPEYLREIAAGLYR